MKKFDWNYLLWLPLLGFIAILSLFVFFNIDHGLQDWLYQTGTGFPFQKNKLYELWLHDLIKIASNSLLWLLLFAVVAPEKLLPTKIRQAFIISWPTFRAPLLVAFLAMISCASAMQSLKNTTGIYCPVQLQEYGGKIELHPKIQVGHLLLINDGKGRCWPAGHSTAGFAWIAMFFAFAYMQKKRAAAAMLVTALIYGHFLGLVQVIRGQHFLSHQFYTMAICWLISLGFFASLYYWQYRHPPPTET